MVIAHSRLGYHVHRHKARKEKKSRNFIHEKENRNNHTKRIGYVKGRGKDASFLLLIPPLHLCLLIFTHNTRIKHRFSLTRDSRLTILEHRTDTVLPPLAPVHERPRHVPDSRPADTRRAGDVATTARTARPVLSLRALLALAECATAFEIRLLHLGIEVVVDGGVFLVGHAFAGDFEHAGFAGVVDDDLFLEFALEEAEALGDVVVVVGVVIWVVIWADEA